ncbi:MAG: hypothetical protein E7655_03435 [Ruminococcaceae bacterium]|nr:hypothetical protein [Oscillospiraceae bacterium]
MKKGFLTLLALLLAFPFTACNTAVDQPDVTGETEDTTASETTAPAEPAFNEAEARQKIYDHMVALANMEWTPNETFDISTPSSKYLQNIIYKKGVTYRGAPYSNGIDGTMQMFADALVDGVYMGGVTKEDVIGFDCSSAIAAAWKTVNPNLKCESTKTMLPKDGNGCEPVGSYDYSVRGTSILTTEVAQASGEQVLCEAYCLLQKGDAIVNRWAKNSAHIRMVSFPPVVVRNADGSINPDKSILTYCDQTSDIREFRGYSSNWQVDQTVTFASLVKNNYLPICIEDFYQDQSREMIFTVNGMNDPSNFPARLSGQIYCTQKIMEGKIAVVDESGNELYSEIKEFKSYVMSVGSFSSVNLRNAIGQKSGKMSFVVSVKTPSTKTEFAEAARFDFTK